MIKIGMMIGDRYEILEKIGTGGMSDVYKAKCHKLNRFVAVKVLKQEFSENENFVSKFRIEAQAAAGLMHPNIVNVYDVGEENGIYYIVMELVEGITLKKYIEKKARLSYKEAISIAIQVSMGIEAAHNNHIIHRDIKPQNIIISRDGKVKVTDFGIAKAATSNTITSNVMGSVHYTSPEQARGGYSDEKSDVYSLGITLYEMLTGRVPFNGETTVAIAIKHIQEEIPSPTEFVPEIPAAVESIVMKCCQKSPERRYQNMAELIVDLKQSLINPDNEFVVQNDADMDGSTRMIPESELAKIKQQTAYREDSVKEDTMRLRVDTEAMYQNEELSQDGEEYEYNPRMEKITTILAVAAGIVLLAIVIVLAVKVLGNTKKPPVTHESSSSPIVTDEAPDQSNSEEIKHVLMPEVTGMMVEDARNMLTALGIFSEVNYEESDTFEAGIVISANVAAESDILPGSTVTLTASAGPHGIEVPSVLGRTYEEASNTLISLGFTVTRLDAYSDVLEAGVVAAQTPGAGNKAAKDSVITLTVSLGKEDVKARVPNLMGMTEQDGTIAAIEAGLQIGTVTYVYSSGYESGLICYQSYSYDSYVDQGTTIDIRVSQGPEPEVKTYKYNASIEAPTAAEAPDYKAGTDVDVKLVANDGKVLLETKVSNFPYSANYYGMTASGGVITMTYTVTTESRTETDADGNEITIPGTKEQKSFTRKVEFTAE